MSLFLNFRIPGSVFPLFSIRLTNKTFCFNGVRLSVEYGFFVFDEEHFIN